jgi:hypothetical protein
VHISTNAATRTDLDAATFWEKIRVDVVRRGGVNTRSGASLQNRFNKVLQADVNKFIGYFHASLREHHSGWSMADYVADASKRFLLKSGKTFKHSLVYDILKRFPKFEVDLSSIDSRVRKAFTMCDDDNEALGKPSGNTNTVDQHGLFCLQRRKRAAAASALALLLQGPLQNR